MSRVALDYLPAVQHAPGVGRYVRELVRALVRRADAPRLVLFEGGLGPRPMAGAPLGLEGALRSPRRRRLPLPRRALAPLARVGLGADRLSGAALFHRVHPGHPPLSSGAHTLAISELPHAGSPADGRLAAAARDAAAVVTFSADLGARAAARFGLDPDRVALAPVGCEHWARDLGGRSVTRREPAEIVALGAVRAARRPLELLRAFEALRERGVDARLVLCGRPGDAAAAFQEALGRSSWRAAVRWIDAPREADLPELVAGATVLAHLADDEGTPVTALEACRLGPSVVASERPALREALGAEALWVPDGADAAAIAGRLAEGLEDGRDGDGRARRARFATAFTWDACAEAHIRLWNRILASPIRQPPRDSRT